jgi:hypothetical protein
MSTATARIIVSNNSNRMIKKQRHLKHGQVTLLVSQNAPYVSLNNRSHKPKSERRGCWVCVLSE